MFGWFTKKLELETEIWEQIMRLWDTNKSLTEALSNLTVAYAKSREEIENLNYQMLKMTDLQNQLVAHVTGSETPDPIAPRVH